MTERKTLQTGMTEQKQLRTGATEFPFVGLHLELLVASGAKLPSRAYDDSIGLDIYAFLLSESGRPNKAILPPRTTRLIPTGISAKPPSGHAILVCSRSGLATHSIFVTNAPGVVDADYRGEIKVLMYNGGHETYYIEHEQRIAQLLVVPLPHVEMKIVTSLEPTARGEKGFGSTGL